MSPAADENQLLYDLFVSYRHREPDRSWVRKTLVPRLESEGLQACIDYRDFRLGEPVVLEMSRAVEQSRYTVAVLTPVYLESNFTELENIMAEHLGLANKERRLLIIMREPCAPRLSLGARLWLDMTDNDEFEVNIRKLVYEMKQPVSGKK
jgi:hypothetical protein